MLIRVNILETDPQTVFDPSCEISASFDDFSNSQKEVNIEISEIEKFLAEIDNFSNVIEDFEDLSEEEQQKIEELMNKVAQVNKSIANIHQKLEVISLDQALKMDQLDTFLDEAKTEQILR